MPAQLLAGDFGTRPTLAPCCGQRRHTHRRSNSPKNVREGSLGRLSNPAHCLRTKVVSSARRVRQMSQAGMDDSFGSGGCWRALPTCRASRSRDHSRRSTRAKKPRQRTALQRNHQSAGSSGAANQLCAECPTCSSAEATAIVKASTLANGAQPIETVTTSWR